MKIHSCIIMVFFLFSNAYSQTDKGISLKQVFSKMCENPSNDFIIGWERIDNAKSKIADTDAIAIALRKLDFLVIRDLIIANTEYQCIIGKSYFLVFPKDDKSRRDIALSKRRVFYPEGANISIDDALANVKALNEEEAVHLSRSSQALLGSLDAKVTIQSGSGTVYELLNNITRQFKGHY